MMKLLKGDLGKQPQLVTSTIQLNGHEAGEQSSIFDEADDDCCVNVVYFDMERNSQTHTHSQGHLV